MLSRFPVAVRLGFGFAVPLVLMALLTLVAISQMRAVDTDLRTINEVNSVLQRYAINFRGSVHDRSIAVRDVVMLEDAAARAAEVRLIEALAEDYAVNEDQMAARTAEVGVDALQREMLTDIAAIKQRTDPIVERIIASRAAGDVAQAERLLDQVRPLYVDWLAAINRFIDYQEAANQEIGANVETSVRNFVFVALATLILAVGLAVAAGFVVSRSITAPLNRLREAMQTLAEGRITETVPGEDRHDEIGAMARTVAVFRDGEVERARLSREAAQEQDRERQRQAQLEALIAKFRETVSEALGGVSKSTDSLRNSAGALSDNAGKAVERSSKAREATVGAAGEVQSVAAASEELASSIREIAAQTQRASGVVDEASRMTEATNAKVESLSEAAEKIGAVVEIIRTIADQTNLLALNATIEAARAGEAGKGFAVVAEEVKQLASQTANATTEIGQQIAAVQASTQESVDAIRSISGAVAEIMSFTQAIAGSVDQQEGATKEIAESITKASRGSHDATSHVEDVSRAIGDTSGVAADVRKLSDDLGHVSATLSGEVERFLEAVASDVDNRRRALRRRTHAAVVVRADGSKRSVTMLDVSETGARLERFEGARADEQLSIEMPDGQTVGGYVARLGSEDVGVQFHRSYSGWDRLAA